MNARSVIAAENEFLIPFSEFAKNMSCSQYRPEGDYLLFPTGGQLHISFRKKDGSWADRISLGDGINAKRTNGSPRVTPDGKYI